jgi:hypothetical protein
MDAMGVAAGSPTIAPADRADARPGADRDPVSREPVDGIRVFGAGVGALLVAVPLGAAAIVGLGIPGVLPVDAMFGSGMAAVVVGFGVFLAFTARIPIAFALVRLRGLVSPAREAEYAAFEREISVSLNARGGYAVGTVLALIGPAYLVIRTGGLASLLAPETPAAPDLPFSVLATAAAAITVAAFAAGLAIWRMWVVGRAVYALGERFELRLQLGHPDGCGGFEPLGNVSLWNALILAVPGAFLGWWIFVGWWAEGAASGAFLARWIPLYSGLAVVVVALAIGTFLAPLWNIHRAMARSADQLRADIEKRGRQIDALARELVVAEDDLTPEERERKAKDLELQQSIFRANERIPTWPIDLRMLLKFGSSQIVPFLGLTGLGKPFVEAAERLSRFLAGTT